MKGRSDPSSREELPPPRHRLALPVVGLEFQLSLLVRLCRCRDVYNIFRSMRRTQPSRKKRDVYSLRSSKPLSQSHDLLPVSHSRVSAIRTAALFSSQSIHALRYLLPFATVSESPTTTSWLLARVIATFKRRCSDKKPTSPCGPYVSESEGRGTAKRNVPLRSTARAR